MVFNGYWYMTFSDQWPTRQTHYIYKQKLDDPWIKPQMNTFIGLYAGKVAASDTKMVLGGWVSHDFTDLMNLVGEMVILLLMNSSKI